MPPPPLRSTLAEAPSAAEWSALLALRSHLRGVADAGDCVFLAQIAGQWRFLPRIEAGDTTATRLIAMPLTQRGLDAAPGELSRVPVCLVRTAVDGSPSGLRRSTGTDPLPPCFAIYLPVVLGAFRAARRGATFVTGHLAQTLDGRIACANGHSQWIGNEANLHHAHRLRALHDAVLVGGRTLAHDNPRLTVRHVVGEDPRRVVLSGSGSALHGPSDRYVFAPPGCVVLCTEAAARRAPALPATVRLLPVPAENGHIAPAAALASLHAAGVQSVFVEGGGSTLSGFLAAGCVDLLHLHLAPIILGSGIAGLSLPPVERIEDGLRLEGEHFTLDGEILLTCAPTRRLQP